MATLKEALSFHSEVELGKVVRKHLEEGGYETFEEVVVNSAETCDMICRKDGELFAIEMKLDLNFKLLAQATRWYGRVNSVYIAVPENKITSEKRVIVKALGIGILAVRKEISFGETLERVRVDLYPERLPVGEYPDKWESLLIDAHAHDAEAGCQTGNRSTPFSRTIEALKLYCTRHPEATLNEALLHTPTHYSNLKSAYGSIMKYSKTGVVEKFWKDPPGNT